VWVGDELILHRVAQESEAALVMYSRSSRSGSQLAAVPTHLSRGSGRGTQEATARAPGGTPA